MIAEGEGQGIDQPTPATVPPTVKGLGLVSLFNDFASEMVYPLLPAFITRTLGGNATMLGALDGAADLAASAVKWISGRLADRPGWRKPLILGGYLCAVLVRPLMSVAGAAWQVVGFRVVDRVGKGARTPPRDAMIADITEPALRGRAFGFHRGADHLGAVLGSVAAWWLLKEQVAMRDVLAWSIVPGVVAFLVLIIVLRGTVPGPLDYQRQSPIINHQSSIQQAFWPPIIILGALTFARLPEALLLLRLQDIGVPIVAIPLVWAGLHVVRSASSYPGGWLVDRLGSRATVAAGGLLFAGAAALLGLDLSRVAAVAVFLTLGLVAGLTESAERALVARLAPARTGSGFGAYHAVLGLAALPAGLLFGWIYQRHGGTLALWVSSGCLVVGVMAWLSYDRVARTAEHRR